jgi:hypothetical protein
MLRSNLIQLEVNPKVKARLDFITAISGLKHPIGRGWETNLVVIISYCFLTEL